MLIFAVLLIVLLWFFQIIYLEKFYKIIKGYEVEHVLSDLSSTINDNDESNLEKLGDMSLKYDLCIEVVNSEGKPIYSVENAFGCTIHSLKMEDMVFYYHKTIENGGKLVFTSDKETNKQNKRGEFQDKRDLPAELDIIDRPLDNKRPIEDNLIKVMRGGNESMVCTSVLDINGVSCLILLDARLTPVEATVNTLRIELIVISVVMVLMALLLALLISRVISAPIIKVNSSAKKLAEGNYNVVFDGRDYREIDELSNTLNYTSKELAKTEKYRQELIANVSHDLRTPLTMITAYAEVMRDIPGENTSENVQTIIDEAERLTNLVNDMLEISKLQQGTLNKEALVYDLTDSVGKVMERYSKLKMQDGYDIRFEYTMHVKVEADEYKIYQVLYNLINNAINYTGNDKKVTVRQIVKQSKVRIEVEDTGYGIEEDEIRNVWDRYYKASNSHKRAVKGTGLGLSIVRDILQLHNALYGVENGSECGTIFWFELDRFIE